MKPPATAQLKQLHPDDSLQTVSLVFREQAAALLAVAERIDDGVTRALELILSARGRVIVSGMGKSGIVGRKIAATLASTGTRAFFVHPGEAYHGDLGMIAGEDVVILISYSGETDEVLKLLPYLHHVGAPIIALTGGLKSTLARNADAVLDAKVEREACPNNLAPTTSTTAALVMGDAIAVALMQLRGFEAHDFARFHPGGSLGRKLLTRVKDVMHPVFPRVPLDAGFKQVVASVTRGRLGIAVVMTADHRLAGVITSGDLGRAMDEHDDPRGLSAADIMTTDPLTIPTDAMFAEAEEAMERHVVTALVAVDAQGLPKGVLKIFDVQA